jgi:hypothetical protein
MLTVTSAYSPYAESPSGYNTEATQVKNDPGEARPSPRVAMKQVSSVEPGEVDEAITEIRARMKQAFKEDPAFADTFQRPLAQDEPQHDILDRMDRGEFQN